MSRAVDEHGTFQHALQLAHPGLHLALGVLCGVVVAILGKISECPGGLDLARDLHAPARRQVLELGHEAGVGLRSENSFSH